MNSLAEPPMDEAELDHLISEGGVVSSHAETIRHLQTELSESALQLEAATAAAVQAIEGQAALREELESLKVSSHSELLELRSCLAATTDRAAIVEAELSDLSTSSEEALAREKALSESLDLCAKAALAQLESLEDRLAQSATRLAHEVATRELLELKLREMIAVSQAEIAKIVSHTERLQGFRFVYREVEALNEKLVDMTASRDVSLELLDAEKRTSAEIRRDLAESQGHRSVLERKIAGLLDTMRAEAQKIVDHTERQHSAVVARNQSEYRLSMADLRIAALSAELDAAREAAAAAERQVESVIAARDAAENTRAIEVQERLAALENAHNEAQQKLLAEIQSSTSWRITSPMRAVVGFFKRA